MENNPARYRARIIAIQKLIQELPVNRDEKNPDRALIRNGFIPDNLTKRFEELVDFEYKLTFSLNEPLSFTELTSFNTWFAMHPEKICGEETSTTSREFPITVKGSKEDITKAIRAGMNTNPPKTSFEKDIEENVPDEDFSENRFGKPEAINDLLLADFHSLYYDHLEKFDTEHKGLSDKIDKLKEELKDQGLSKEEKKEKTDTLNFLSSQLNAARVFFEDDWIKFWIGVKEMIEKKALEMGFYAHDIEEYDIPGDILIAMTDRPWTETYWDWKVKDVIFNELNSLTFPRKIHTEKDDKIGSETLELEALALETELLLLVLSDNEMKRSMQ